jgi:hypothetical protein
VPLTEKEIVGLFVAQKTIAVPGNFASAGAGLGFSEDDGAVG